MRVWCATTYIDLGKGIECPERQEKKGGKLPGDHCGQILGNIEVEGESQIKRGGVICIGMNVALTLDGG